MLSVSAAATTECLPKYGSFVVRFEFPLSLPPDELEDCDLFHSFCLAPLPGGGIRCVRVVYTGKNVSSRFSFAVSSLFSLQWNPADIKIYDFLRSMS